MKFKEWLQEEFAGSRKMRTYTTGKDTDIEFFSNPKAGEVKDVFKASGKTKSIRFYVDFDRKEVIIWEGGALHQTAMNILIPSKSKNRFFMGVSRPDAGKMRIVGSDTFDSIEMGGPTQKKVALTTLYKIGKGKDWLSKYFTNVVDFMKDNLQHFK